ncbi:hypothetical protein [Bacillus sp. REN3]|uniref:NAD(P)H-dependent amine dehydrogenase family protein n=1 Tax=Bacillus sp. REN3 TaxID=2802440 RepID=UPI001AED24FA|nr:hypothetical protein [Bacillus sp. REN3]
MLETIAKKTTNEKLDLLLFGLGPIGIQILKKSVLNHGANILGAIDIDPDKVGKDIGDLIGTRPHGISVTSGLKKRADEPKSRKVAIHATGSNLKAVWPQIRELLDHGYSVVSTCEQLSFPWHRYPQLAKEIDQYARKKNLAVLGTGVNPGFIMDSLPVFLSSVTNEFSSINITRKVDVSKRRIPLQKKVGVGMTKDAFNQLATENKIGHVGLEESLRMVAHALGLELGSVDNMIEPVLAESKMDLALCSVEIGDVCGQHQISKGYTKDGKEVVLELTMAAGIVQEDRIVYKGEEKVELVIPNGIFGDTATAAIAINSAKALSSCEQTGLLSMVDIPVTRNSR